MTIKAINCTLIRDFLNTVLAYNKLIKVNINNVGQYAEQKFACLAGAQDFIVGLL